jgi:hypothetical protein
MKKTLPFIVLMLAGILGRTQASTGPESIIENNEEYSFVYPKDWRFDNSGDMGAKFTLYSTFTSEEDNYNDYIQLNVLPVPGLNMTLDKHLESVIKDIPFFYQKSEITVQRKAEKGGRECAVLAYHGLFNDFALSHYQYIWLANDKVYTLSFSGQPADVELLLPKATLIMDSLIIK